MKRELYNAINRGRHLLEAKGPPDWRQRIAKGFECDGPGYCNIIYWLSGSSDNFYQLLVTLDLATREEARATRNNSFSTEGRRVLERITQHAYWPNDDPNTLDSGPWTHEELAQAWQQIISNQRVTVPE